MGRACDDDTLALTAAEYYSALDSAKIAK